MLEAGGGVKSRQGKGRDAEAQALVVQCIKATHQFALDGSWGSHMAPHLSGGPGFKNHLRKDGARNVSRPGLAGDRGGPEEKGPGGTRQTLRQRNRQAKTYSTPDPLPWELAVQRSSLCRDRTLRYFRVGLSGAEEEA